MKIHLNVTQECIDLATRLRNDPESDYESPLHCPVSQAAKYVPEFANQPLSSSMGKIRVWNDTMTSAKLSTKYSEKIRNFQNAFDFKYLVCPFEIDLELEEPVLSSSK